MSKQSQEDINVFVHDKIIVSESIITSMESDYLIISNRKKVAELLSKPELEEEDIIDTFIALHIVLEVSLNTFFRHVSLSSIKKDIDKLEVIKNLDNISFIDKTILFIYNSKFNFQDIGEASYYHSIIATLRDFSFIRNQLLHGHSISTVTDENGVHHSNLKKFLNEDALQKQVRKFLFILQGMQFYLGCLDSPLTPAGREAYKKSYLNDEFVPTKYKS